MYAPVNVHVATLFHLHETVVHIMYVTILCTCTMSSRNVNNDIYMYMSMSMSTIQFYLEKQTVVYMQSFDVVFVT